MEDRMNGVCYICGNELKWNPDAENCYKTDSIGEGYYVEEIVCPECGTLHRAWVGDREDSDDNEDFIGSIGDQGFGNCIHCGSTLVWSGDFMRSDYECYLDEDDDSLVRSLTCSGCGAAVEVIEPSKNEVKSCKYPHWKGYENI